jgi:hypothetical protein
LTINSGHSQKRASRHAFSSRDRAGIAFDCRMASGLR